MKLFGMIILEFIDKKFREIGQMSSPKLKKIAKRMIGRDFRTIVPSLIEKEISNGARVTARLVGVAVALLMRPFALFENKKSLFDASSAVYFLGKKTDAKRVSHKELVALYDGQFPSVDG